MVISTAVGSGTMTCLLVSTATNVVLTQNVETSLMQAASETITTTGNHVAFLFRSDSDNDSWCQVSLKVDGVEVYNDSSGTQDSFNVSLSAGSHIIAFTAIAFNGNLTMLKCGLTILDLGI